MAEENEKIFCKHCGKEIEEHELLYCGDCHNLLYYIKSMAARLYVKMFGEELCIEPCEAVEYATKYVSYIEDWKKNVFEKGQ